MSYLRLPHLHDDLLCFVAEDDLWLAPLDAPGRAWRLTVDRTKVGHPRFSPDGRHLAYTSWRTLVPEVHLVPVDGGPGRRLTHWGSADTRVCGWTPDGEILAVASHGEPFSFFTWGYKVPLDGAPGRKLPWGPVADLQVADLDGERKSLLLTGTPPHEPASWKRYRGGAMGRLWLHGERLLAGLGGHLHSPLFVGGRIAFLSDHEGIGNLYSCAYDGSDLRRHTDHDAFYARHASSDGTRVVYQCAGDLWLVDDLSPDSEPRRLDVRLSGPRAGRRPYQVAAAQHIDGISVDETGRASAVVVRGSLYWLTHRDGPARTLTDTPGVRVRMPEMLGASGRVAYVTDAEGEDAIEIASLPRASGDREPRRPAPGGLGRVRELVSDPEGERLAVASHDGRLLLVDVTEGSDGEVTELIRSINGPVRDLAFSPDGAWLTWSHPGIGRTLRQIKMARLAGTAEGDSVVIDVTNGRFEDENPVFTRDGRYLAFLSWRGFDPVYDVHTGDLSFPLGCRPYLVPLSSATPSPFAVNPEGRPAAGGLDPVEDDENGDGGAVTVEAEGLESRVTPFPVAASKYSALHPVAGGGLVWLRWPISGALGETFANPDDTSGRPTLEHFGITKAKKSELVGHLDWFAVSGDGSRLVVVDEGELRAVPATEQGDADSTVWIDARRILHVVDPAAEWRQAYEEAGRLTGAYFWEPGMCGIDWAGVLDQYRPLVERVASPDEFADLLREVLGELGTSHAYVTAARRNEGPPHYQRRQGLLGANFVRRDGGWTVKRILAGDSSDSKARSPLAGTGIREGAVLTHVDGRPVDPDAGPYPLLAGAGATTVELTFTPAEDSAEDSAQDSAEGVGPPRRVAVVPLVDERPLRYQDWVAKRRAVVRELSGGRCGYLHIPDMGGSGWAQFNRDLRMEVSRPALIVDVRGNAGGHISELVIETLSRTILGWDLTRDAQPVSYLSNAPRGPVVALADEATSSDGDMITAAFKLLKLGPVVGQRTWGGVVGMTGRHELGDGTVITVPMNAAWFDAYGWSVENRGVAPDIDVLRTPLDWAEGRHAQLTDAVELALGLLETDPPATPPTYSDVPDRSRPKLPPRT
ncbi:putative tricorn protease [Streptomyces violarus]|uniref:Tricorn protease homolog n=1 Tax=Streptomyces violarus TaxID=67380 RepID=A0A7W4ZX52_9ACTN|nr:MULTISPECIES: S41 family peptidase [Streptomyces]MBB3080230.1 tricorn protease [Streptomyces violarus]WRU00670.1 S41 family peptidase [Streptomyces sp. CGMCC 4.1772]GHD14651.1 putative tricorn protease [Streptomyces violarus]